MKLLSPLGLLGLIAVAILILIYILRPNFQQKRISSTYVWKLSLKYRKKRIPISKLRNILIIICQVLILASCAVILAQPNKILKEEVDYNEVIAIIDSSASMRTISEEEETRFERAINGVLKTSDEILAQNGVMSVIIADPYPYFLIERTNLENKPQLVEILEAQLEDDMKCTYGSADIDTAISMCEGILKDNPSAKIYIYTDTTYVHVPQGITVVNVSDRSDWNAAILNARAEIEENYYVFYVDVACYGRDTEISLNIEVQNANALDKDSEGIEKIFRTTVECSQDTTKTVIFKYFNENEELPEDNEENRSYYYIDSNDAVYSYQSVHISITEKDSFNKDNSFYIYGGQKEVLRVQYSSTLANSFFNSVLIVLKNALNNRLDIQITEVKDGQYALEGFDFYIFEHNMPITMPADGVVFLINPDIAPLGSGISLDKIIDFKGRSISLTEEMIHPILKSVTADDITISRYVRINNNYEPSYQVLLACFGDPILMVKDENAEKVVIMPFSVHYSNLTILPEFPILLYNMFQYFLPTTVTGNAFEVFENISLRARGTKLNVTGENVNTDITSFPSTLTIFMPGTYLIRQTTFSGKKISEEV